MVHSDICGPFKVPTLAGNMYFITFVDEFRKMIWLYVLRLKSETFEDFMRLKAYVERQSEKLLNTLRIDGGGKYTSNAFENRCQTRGIVHQGQIGQF